MLSKYGEPLSNREDLSDLPLVYDGNETHATHKSADEAIANADRPASDSGTDIDALALKLMQPNRMRGSIYI